MELTIVDDDAVKITASEGDTDIAVVSFSGVAFKMGEVPKEEFVKTLKGDRHGQYFVIDKNRTWYNSTSDEIMKALEPHLKRYKKTITLGNSMGGFGAVYFASRLPNCQRAISFVPQFSVDPKVVPQEDRWQMYRSRIRDWRISDAMAGADPNMPLDVFFGAQQKQDALHVGLFREQATPATSVYVLEGAAHNLAGYLRNGGALKEVLDAIILENAAPQAISDLLNRKNLKHVRFGPAGEPDAPSL